MKLTPGFLKSMLGLGDEQDDPKRDAVLDAAKEAFLDFGVRRTSMLEISRRSGVSTTTLYRWYSSKEDITNALLVREARRFLVSLEEVDRSAPAEDQLVEMTVRVFRRLGDMPLLDRLVETEPENILPKLTSHASPMLALGTTYLAVYLERLMDEGLITKTDPRPVAEVLVRFVHSLVLTPTSALPIGDEQAIEPIVRALLQQMLGFTPDERG